MRVIPQRELRNNSGAILREAEGGAEFTITVGGRPVATLGPHRRRQWIPREEVAALLLTPSDPGVLADLEASYDQLVEDPWAQ